MYCECQVCQHLITVRLQNAEGVPPENSQRHSLGQEMTLLIRGGQAGHTKEPHIKSKCEY